jgi:subtilase family serine protease
LFALLLLHSTWAQAVIPQSLQHVGPRQQVTRSINEADRVKLSGNRLPILAGSVDQGAVSDNLVLKGMVLHLNSSAEQQAALDTFNTAQHTPGSADFHHWLTPEEFASRFGVAMADINALSSYLTSKGFKVESVSTGGRAITFTGTAGQIKNTFHTEIHHYLWHGEAHIANSSDPQIPAAFAGVVNGLVNIHDFHSHSRKHSQLQNSTPSIGKTLPSDYTSKADIYPITNYDIGGANFLTPSDYAVIYDINSLYQQAITGSGYSISVLGRSAVLNSDISTFQSFAGLSSNAPNVIVTNTNPGYVSGDQLESSLDLEWAGGIAPGATLNFITSSTSGTTDGIQVSAAYAVQHNVGDIISLSYAACEHAMGRSQVNYWSSLWNQAATQGQTVVVAAGDSGAAGCDSASSSTATGGAYVNGLCSSKYNTCVGGTQFNDANSGYQYWQGSNTSGSTTTALSYIPESAWNASASVSGGSQLWASGGGKSVYVSKPSWQTGTGVPSDGARDVPDVSMAAALHDGYMVYLNGSQVNVGGTSAATPSFAGIIALLLQYTGSRQGNINTTLYGLWNLQTGGGYDYFHTTVSGNNTVPGQTGYTASGTGYNLATGLGSVDATLLVTHWTDISNSSSSKVHAALQAATSMLIPVSTSVSLSSSAASITAGGTVTLTATVSGDLPTGSVQFYAGSTSLGSATINSGVGTLTTTALATAGSDALVAVYSGDSNNLSSTSAALTETVLTATTISISTSASSVSSGQSVTLTATLSGNSPSGSVQFYLNGATLGSPVSIASGVATLTTPITVTGLDNITATYSGDSANAAITSSAITETVTAAQPQPAPALSPAQELLLALLLAIAIIRFNSKKTAYQR